MATGIHEHLTRRLYSLGVARQWEAALDVLRRDRVLESGVKFDCGLTNAILYVLTRWRGFDEGRGGAAWGVLGHAEAMNVPTDTRTLISMLRCCPARWADLLQRLPWDPAEDYLWPTLFDVTATVGGGAMYRGIFAAMRAPHFEFNGTLALALALAKASPPCMRWRVASEVLPDVFPLGLERTQRWAHGLATLERMRPVTPDAFREWQEVATLVWGLNGEQDVGVVLKVNPSEQMFLLRSGLVAAAGRLGAVGPVTVPKMAELIGLVLTAGFARDVSGPVDLSFALHRAMGRFHSVGTLGLPDGIEAVVTRGGNIVLTAPEGPYLEDGDVVSFPALDLQPRWPTSSTPSGVVVLYRSGTVIALSKPCGLDAVNHTGATANSVLAVVAGNYPGVRSVTRCGVVHRLDKVASGAMVFALTQRAHSFLGGQVRLRALRRVYMCLSVVTTGTAALKQGDTGDIRTSHVMDGAGGRKANVHRDPLGVCHTAFEVVEAFPRYRMALLRCTLHSGKKHQIRAHLALEGMPILGDVMYGGVQAVSPAAGPGWIFLHASELRFPHPDGYTVALDVTLSREFEEQLAFLRC